MSTGKLLWLIPVVAVLGLAAQEQVPQKTVQHASAKYTSPNSGSEMFKNYCAVCHGMDGKGGGPAAGALKAAPADLTTLSKSHGGKFPAAEVAASIRGEHTLAAHGTQEMPVWGPVFYRMSGGRTAEVHMRVSNLVHYIEALQEK
jgi:mono/diheme cytochrome c family protein